MPPGQQRIGRLLAAIGDATGDEFNLIMDEVVKALRVANYVWDPAGMVSIKEQQGATEANVQDQLLQYKQDDFDISGTPFYLGFQDKDGNWFIQRINISTGAIDYASGTSGYSTAWTGRAGLGYTDFAGAF